MTREQVATLLKSGVLQAYAEGKEIEVYKSIVGQWVTPTDPNDISFVYTGEYRIKPEPIPHTFLTACAAIGKHGKEIWDDKGSYLGTINEIGQNGFIIIDHNRVDSHYFYSEATKFTQNQRLDIPFHQGTQT